MPLIQIYKHSYNFHRFFQYPSYKTALLAISLYLLFCSYGRAETTIFFENSDIFDYQRQPFLQPTSKAVKPKCKDSNFEGIGATLTGGGYNDVVVVRPLANSPALRAGLRSGDVIRQVDGRSIKNMSLYDVISRIRGPRKTIVTLYVERWRKGKERTALSIRITRDVIDLKCRDTK